MLRIGRRRGAPADCIEEGIEPARIVERVRLGKGGTLEDARAGFDLPNDLEGLVRLGVVVDASEASRGAAAPGGLERIAAKLICLDLSDDPSPLAYQYELALLWKQPHVHRLLWTLAKLGRGLNDRR